MELKLVRTHFTGRSTEGELYADGKHVCYTLEDCSRPGQPKVPHRTCIPAGKYKVVLDFSLRFQRIMPHVLSVPGFEGIRIHTGNTDKDTEGCILVGTDPTSPDDNFLANSREAYAKLMKLLNAADKKKEKITLEVIEAR